MRCIACSAELLENARFCNKCGRPVEAPTQEEETIARAPRSPLGGAEEEEGTVALTRAIHGPSQPAAEETVVMPLKPARLGYLIEVKGPRASHVHPLSDDTSVGRDAGQNAIVVDDPAVSKTHARVKLQETGFVLYDLASKNGTWLRTRSGRDRIESPHALKEGEVIELGNRAYAFMELTTE